MTQPNDAEPTGPASGLPGDADPDADGVDEAERARAHEEWAAADALLEGQPTELGE